MAPRYTEQDAREAVAASRTFTEALRRLGMCPTGGAQPVLRKWVGLWGIDTSHFDPAAVVRESLQRAARTPRPLEELLIEDSPANRGALKERLYDAGLKERRCELCGQGEEWRGRRMTLILDHVNGRSRDNRLENLRIVCPNCNATLDTHCGRNATVLGDRSCERCSEVFRPKYGSQRFCSRACGSRHERKPRPLLHMRLVERPPYEQLRAEVDLLGWSGTGRKYGVSDNAIRKWVRAYERERDARLNEDRAA